MVSVLVITSDLSLTLLLEAALEREGYQVMTASDGASGVEMAHDQPPDVIILASRLTRLSSADVIQYLRATPDTADIPIVLAVTDHLFADSPDQQCDAHLRLPARPQEIIAAVAGVLNGNVRN